MFNRLFFSFLSAMFVASSVRQGKSNIRLFVTDNSRQKCVYYYRVTQMEKRNCVNRVIIRLQAAKDFSYPRSRFYRMKRFSSVRENRRTFRVLATNARLSISHCQITYFVTLIESFGDRWNRAYFLYNLDKNDDFDNLSLSLSPLLIEIPLRNIVESR